MRSFVKVAALTVFAASTLAAPVAFAGFDEAGENSFWTHQSVAPPAAEPQVTTNRAERHSNRNEQYRATYAAPTATAPAQSPQKDPPYFYHAMGTMGQP